MSTRGKRDLAEAAIVSALQKAGCSVHYAEKQPYDVLVGRGGVNYALEIKSPRGRLTAAQNAFRENWRGHWAVVYSAAEALKAVGL